MELVDEERVKILVVSRLSRARLVLSIKSEKGVLDTFAALVLVLYKQISYFKYVVKTLFFFCLTSKLATPQFGALVVVVFVVVVFLVDEDFWVDILVDGLVVVGVVVVVVVLVVEVDGLVVVVVVLVEVEVVVVLVVVVVVVVGSEKNIYAWAN